MEADTLSQQLVAMRRRVASLYQAAPRSDTGELLAKAFEELQYAIEQLHMAEDLLQRSRRELNTARDAQEQERQHTLDTFNWVPVPYIVTGLDGTIKRVNHAAVSFLNQNEKFLLGKSLGLFIPEGGRRAFRSELETLRTITQTEERMLRLHPHSSRPLDVCMTVGIARDRAGRPIALHWLINSAATMRQAEAKRRYEYASV